MDMARLLIMLRCYISRVLRVSGEAAVCLHASRNVFAAVQTASLHSVDCTSGLMAV